MAGIRDDGGSGQPFRTQAEEQGRGRGEQDPTSGKWGASALSRGSKTEARHRGTLSPRGLWRLGSGSREHAGASESLREPPRAPRAAWWGSLKVSAGGCPDVQQRRKGGLCSRGPRSGRVRAFLETILHDAVQASEDESHPDTPTHTVCTRAYAHVYLPICTHACAHTHAHTHTHTLQLIHTEAQLINGRTVARRASWNPLNKALSRGTNGPSLS